MAYLSALSPKVQNVWASLGRTGDKYVLVGGTALAWRLGHRVSFDVDLATSGPCEHPRVLRSRWANDAIGKHKWLRKHPDHYIKFFATETTPKIDVHGRVPAGCLALPTRAENGLRIASVTDILKQKLVAMAFREEVRDGEDVVAILTRGRANVRLAVAALRDESGIGVGEDDAERLGKRLQDLPHSPWRGLPALAALVPELLSEHPVALKLASERIEGPEILNRLQDALGHEQDRTR